MTGTISSLVLATLVFIGIHIIPSSFLRGALVSRVGLGVYLAGYSLLSAAALIWMIMAYIAAPYGPVYWEFGNWTRYAAIAGMLVAAILFVGPYTGRSPTGIGGQKTVNTPAARSGLNAITRHPLMWAFAIWSAVHLLNNGDLRSIIFFAGFGGMALLGSVMIDKKRAKEIGSDYLDYAKATSNIPFMALLQRRASLSIKDVWWRVLIGLFAFMAFFHLHTMIIGVSPFPL